MKNLISIIFLFFTISVDGQEEANKKYVLVIHGGAGFIEKSSFTEEREYEYKQKLEEALKVGYAVLDSGRSSLDAVTEAIQILENSPLFNAGKGAVYTHQETVEHDASIMNGKDKNAGAIAGVSHIKNPITAARKVMEVSEHVMLSGKGAEEFAKSNGVEMVDTSYFFNQRRLDYLKKIKEEEKLKDDQDDRGQIENSNEWQPDEKFGTVGAVAVDKDKNLAAGTSTGGMTNKKYGRIGDSPIIGAGTYADNSTCAVSSTGHGEYFIRSVVAYDIAALMEYKNWPLSKAAHHVVMEKLVEFEGSGGVIAIDAEGNIAMPFNTTGMFRGMVDEDGNVSVFLYGL